MERKPLSFTVNITVTGARNLPNTFDGSGNNTTPSNCAIYNAGGYIRQIIVKPPQESATYDFRIMNANSHNVLKRTDVSGEIADDVQTPMPAGTYTLYVERASHNGTYEVEIIYAEVY